ncbi:iron donor protein CyaY [Telmatospirillum sp. J64-1]|uniref:iron donor protein CyaY n=1 Tax=Telmatospirillum sp. J64-1 TaxID=2502183 RepID=UPI00115F4EA7|nr:iron donor protein CyaY [Telmatospirillum sp. J64-1]
MSLDESSFHTIADHFLSEIADRIEDALGDDLDVELQGGILTIELEDGRQFIVNKHAPNRQVWLSSPVSGAWHFGYQDGRWIATKDASVELRELLGQELGTDLSEG